MATVLGQLLEDLSGRDPSGCPDPASPGAEHREL